MEVNADVLVCWGARCALVVGCWLCKAEALGPFLSAATNQQPQRTVFVCLYTMEAIRDLKPREKKIRVAGFLRGPRNWGHRKK